MFPRPESNRIPDIKSILRVPSRHGEFIVYRVGFEPTVEDKPLRIKSAVLSAN